MSANQIVSEIKPRKWIYFGINNLTGRDIFVLQPKFDEKRELRLDRAATGCSRLIDHYRLAARPLPVVARLDNRVKGRATRRQGSQDVLIIETKYQPQDNLVGHLQFALRYEGINLEVLAVLFDQAGAAEIDAWLDASPQSAYARRAGHRK